MMWCINWCKKTNKLQVRVQRKEVSSKILGAFTKLQDVGHELICLGIARLIVIDDDFIDMVNRCSSSNLPYKACFEFFGLAVRDDAARKSNGDGRKSRSVSGGNLLHDATEVTMFLLSGWTIRCFALVSFLHGVVWTTETGNSGLATDYVVCSWLVEVLVEMTSSEKK